MAADRAARRAQRGYQHECLSAEYGAVSRVRLLVLLGPPEPPLTAAEEALRPRSWTDCERDGWGTPELPCPFVGCAMHLYLDVSESGSLVLNWPGYAVAALPETCARRAAANGPATLDEVGARLQLTREAVRVIERRALAELKRTDAASLEEMLDASRARAAAEP